MKLRIVVIALSLCSMTAHAELNKWVDADGSVHYSDTLPPEVSKAQTVRNITGKGQVEAPAKYSPKSYAEREAELKKSKQEKEEVSNRKGQEEAETEERKRNCVAAQQNLRALEEGTRIVTYDANGERTYLDDTAREQRLNDARKVISANCS